MIKMEPILEQRPNHVKLFAGVIAALIIVAAAGTAILATSHPSLGEEVATGIKITSPLVVKYDPKTQILTLSGDYDIGETDFNSIAKVLYGWNTPVKAIVLTTSNGGAMSVGELIGSYIYTHQIPVIAENSCASSCAYAWFGGAANDDTYVAEDASLLQHLPYNQATMVSDDSDVRLLILYFAQIGISDDTADFIKWQAYSAGVQQDKFMSNNVPDGLFDFVDFAKKGGITVIESSWKFYRTVTFTPNFHVEKEPPHARH